MIFAPRAAVIQDFTRDKRLIADKIKTMNETTFKTLGRGGTAINEAVYQSAIYMKRSSNPASRRVIIAVTDDISTQGNLPGLRGPLHTKKEALQALFESGSVVCGLIVRSRVGKILHAITRSPDQRFFRWIRSVGSIDTYARKTGGIAINSKSDEIQPKLVEIIDRLRARYSIGYVSSNNKRDGKFRRVKIKLSPDVEKREEKPVVQTRQGYFAWPSDNTASVQKNESW